MEIRYTELGTGNIGICFDENMLGWYRPEFEEIVKKGRYRFFFLDRKQFQVLFRHDFLNRVSYRRLCDTFKKSQSLAEYYDSLKVFLEARKVKFIIFNHTGQYWHPDFIARLRKEGIKTALWTADDDSETIHYCSLPYTRHHDCHFHVGVQNGKVETIAETLRKYGGNPIWIPFGARAFHVNETINFKNRDIDICYIGNVNPRKLFRLSKIKRHFGNRFILCGGQGNGDWRSIKGMLYKVANKIFQLGYIKPLTEKELMEMYSRVKIGFNMHLFPDRGPSNARLYELPINGVMQLCDNPIGMKNVFKNGKEIVTYDDMDDAIGKIEYYLSNSEARIRIAQEGYKKALERYRCVTIIETVLSQIQEKDYSPI